MSATPIFPEASLLASEAARVIGRSAQGVRYLEDTGRITSIRVGGRGWRIYARADCERLAEELKTERSALPPYRILTTT